MKRVCVFCGSNAGRDAAFADAARALGEKLVGAGLGLVYGGGRVGLMGVLADAVMGAGGEAIGVIPQNLMRKELAHTGLTELRVVPSMHERKALMAGLADGFIALPGGIGTLEEFFEIWTWGQLGLHGKPYGLLNVAGFYDPLLLFLERLVQQGFIKDEHRKMVLVGNDPGELLGRMQAHQPHYQPKWIAPAET